MRWVALFEAFKGLLVLAAASGVLLLVHRDVHALAARLIEHAHLNPASHYPLIFLDLADRLQDARLWLLALGAAAYSALRLVEAYGLFLGRAWAEVLAAASGAIYLPIELYEMLQGATAMKAAFLLVNAAIVAIMLGALLQRRRRGGENADRPPH